MNIKKLLLLSLLGTSLLTSAVYANSNQQDGVSGATTKNTTDQNLAICVGAPVDKEWTFKADKAGTYKITFTYQRPWEKGVAPIETKTYTIQVKGNKKTKTIVTVEEDKKASVNVGQSFTIKLEENPSTGYSWTYKVNNNHVSELKK